MMNDEFIRHRHFFAYYCNCSVFNRYVNELVPVCLNAAHGHEHVAGLHLPRIEAD